MKTLILRCVVRLGRYLNPGFLLKHQGIARFWDRVLAYDINHFDDLEEFQKRDTLEILRIIYKYYPNPRKISVLDIGCSASTVKYLAGHVKKIVGINIEEDHLNIRMQPKNSDLLYMDATKLLFQNKTFDFVYSANLYEHINDLSKCIDEQMRVLKDGGYCYARWEPVWSGPRGHHIHDDTVRRYEQAHKVEESIYQNNGQFIEDWSHLLLSKNEMFNCLVPKLKNSILVKSIIENIYDSAHINRLFYDDVKDVFQKKDLNVIFWNQRDSDLPKSIQRALKAKYPQRNFSACNGELLFQHKASKGEWNS